MEKISSVAQSCHSLDLPLEAGNVAKREQGLVVYFYWETSNNTELYLEKFTFISLFLAQIIFKS